MNRPEPSPVETPPQAMSPGRHWPLALAGLLMATSAEGFLLSSTHWGEGEATVLVDIASSNPPGPDEPNVVAGGPSAAELDAAYIEAMDAWTNSSTFRWLVDTNSGHSDPCPNDGINGVKFADVTCSGAFGSTTLAVQQRWSSEGLLTKTGTVFNNTKEWDIYSGPWTGVTEFRRVAVHELGHGLGLDHPLDNVVAIMQALAGDTEVPQADDLAGAAAFYDTDDDGVGLADDNCPEDDNGSQSDLDSDGLGDACDPDLDGDGVFDTAATDLSVGLSPLGSSLFAVGPDSSNSAFSHMAQTFIAGIAGQLLRVDLPVYCPSGNLEIRIEDVLAGEPNGTELTSANFSGGVGVPTTNQGLVEFALPGATLGAGTAYAIVLEVAGECRWVQSDEAYAGGDGLLSTNGVAWQSVGDFAFQTFVDPMPFDNCTLVANPGQEDADADGVGDACDGDGDGDGVPTADDLDDSNPLVCRDADADQCDDCSSGMDDPANDGTDTDTDGLCNTGDNDDDGDGFSDDDEILAGSDPLDANSVPPSSDTFISVHRLWDMNGDGVEEVGQYGLRLNNDKPQLVVKDPVDGSTVTTFTWEDDWRSPGLHRISDRNGDGVDELAIFGLAKSDMRPQLTIKDGANAAAILATVSWPAGLTDARYTELDDATNDTLSEHAISGFDGLRLKVVVRDGASPEVALPTAAFPPNWDNALLLQTDDVNGDGVQDLALFGQRSVNGRNQLVVRDGIDPSIQHLVFNWGDNWDDPQLVVLDDLNSDGVRDVALKGIRKDDGRAQMVVKHGSNRSLGIRNYGWPVELTQAQYMRVPDRDGDGLAELGMTGVRSDNGNSQIIVKRGANQQTLEIAGWNTTWVDGVVHLLADLSGDGTQDFALLGNNAGVDYAQLVVIDSDSGATLRTFSWPSMDATQATLIELADMNNDGVPEVGLYSAESGSGVLQIKNGANHRQVLSTVTWPAAWY